MTPPAEWFRRLAEMLRAQPTLLDSVHAIHPSRLGTHLDILLRSDVASVGAYPHRAVSRWAEALDAPISTGNPFASGGWLCQRLEIAAGWVYVWVYVDVEGPIRPQPEGLS